jgi:hypothetical protein
MNLLIKLIRITGKNDRKTSEPDLITMLLFWPNPYIVAINVSETSEYIA